MRWAGNALLIASHYSPVTPLLFPLPCQMYGAPQLRGVGFTLICFALTERLDLIAAIHHRPRPELRATHCVGGSETAYTGALNFDLNDELGFFVRYTKGFLFPHFDDIRENRNTVDEVKQLEGGVKFSRDGLDLYATAFFNENDAFSSTVGGVLPPTAFTTEASGIELDGTLQLGAIRINVIGTLQETEITDSTTPADVGNQVLRQPEWQMRISPSYVWEADDFNATFYVSATLVGDRFDDNANTVELEGYEKIDLGVLAEFTGGLFVQAHADNINDSEGITEGDPRDPSAPNPFSAAPSCSA